MNDTEPNHDESRMMRELQNESLPKRLKTYLSLSGPGFLQSAFTLGAGSLASSLYLGVLTGYSMLWLQPVAMVLGIIMLVSLGYITLVSNKRPFDAVYEHVNPILAWGWALAAFLASVVWALPQFSLAMGVIQQNLMPGLLGSDGWLSGTAGMVVISIAIVVITYFISLNYDKGKTGVRIYEWFLKGVVAVIVISFVGVVIRLFFITGAIDWAELGRGLIPDVGMIFRPAEGFLPFLAVLDETSRAYWTQLIVSRQQDVMAAALSSAVGINMTFLFGYSMLRRRWGAEHRGLMTFDLGFGMLVPFLLAAGCVIIASASQFHTVPQPGIIEEFTAEWEPTDRQLSEYNRLLEERVLFESVEGDLSEHQIVVQIESLGREDHRMAAMLITRDAFDLSSTLEPLLGRTFGHIIFGIGVLAMALSSITLMMVVCGFVVCEVTGKPDNRRLFRIGAAAPVIGILIPFFWDQAFFWLAIPTSIITLMFLPIAYITFLLMMNNKTLLGEYMPRGKRRVLWNTLMIAAVALITLASLYMLWTRGGTWGLVLAAIFLASVGLGEWKKNVVVSTSNNKTHDD